MTDLPSPLSQAEALRRIQFILQHGRFVLSSHARQQMRRRNIFDVDIVRVLQHGDIIREPEWNIEHRNWVYRVEGFSADDEELCVITVIVELDMMVLVVTTF